MNESPATASQSLGGNPERKTLLAFLFWRGGEVSFEKGKGVFFGVLPSKYSGSAAGLQCSLGFAKTIFLGKRTFRFASADFPPAGGVWGEMRAGFSFSKKYRHIIKI